MVGKREQPARDGVARGLRTRAEQQAEEQVQLTSESTREPVRRPPSRSRRPTACRRSARPALRRSAPDRRCTSASRPPRPTAATADALREPPKSNCGSMASNSQCRSDSGTPSRMQIICIGSSAATSTTKSSGSPGSTASSSRRARARRSSSTRRIIRGVRPELTSRRICECRGSSIMLSTWPAMARSCSSVPPYGRSPPVTDEYVSGSRSTARVSA